MPSITRAALTRELAQRDPRTLRALLLAAGFEADEGEAAEALSERLTRALWWSYSTPLGYALDRSSLEDIVDHVVRRLKLSKTVQGNTAWEKLDDLTWRLVDAAEADPAKPLSLDDIDPATRKRLGPAWGLPALLTTGAGGSLGAMKVGQLILRLGATPVGRLLPLLPKLGKYWRVIEGGAGVAASVGGPLALGLSLAGLNQVLGANYRRLVPLLLGVGALHRATEE